MKNQILAVITFVMLVFSSCSSDDSNGDSNTDPVVTDGFSWTENGGSTVKTATAATFSTQFKTFMVKDANNAPLFEINLTGTAAGTYPMGSANAFTGTGVNPFFIAAGGNLVITSNANGKVSGTFDVTGSGGGLTSVKGTFTNVAVVQ